MSRRRPGRGPRTTFQGKETTLMALVLWWKTGRPLRSPASPSPEHARRTCGEKRCINPAHLKVVRFGRIAPTEVVEAYREGATLHQLADRYGVPVITCHRIIHELAPGLMRGKARPGDRCRVQGTGGYWRIAGRACLWGRSGSWRASATNVFPPCASVGGTRNDPRRGVAARRCAIFSNGRPGYHHCPSGRLGKAGDRTPVLPSRPSRHPTGRRPCPGNAPAARDVRCRKVRTPNAAVPPSRDGTDGRR